MPDGRALGQCQCERARADGPPPAASVVSPWRKFTSQEGLFVAEFPGEPTITTDAYQTGLGLIQKHLYVVEDPSGRRTFMVTWEDFPALNTKVPAAKLLDGAERGSLKHSGGTLVPGSERHIEVDGHPGLEFAGTVDGLTMRSRMVMAGTRLYHTMVVYPTAEKVGDVWRFISSLKILK